MKINSLILLDSIRNFAINFSVGCFLLGVFEKANLGITIGFIFVFIVFLTSLNRRKK